MDETLFDAMRPIVMNGISEAASRGDLLERTIMVNLPVIPDKDRLTEEAFWRDFREAQPRILGAILDGVSAALRNYKNVTLPAKPRMADFAVWATAAESGIRLERGRFMKAYSANRIAANEIPFDASPIAHDLQALSDEGWRGTAKELLAELNKMEEIGMPGKKMPKGWPESPRRLSADLKRLAPHLRRAGVQVEFCGGSHARTRAIALSRVGAETSPTSPTSPSPTESKDYGGDVHGDVSNARNGTSPTTSPIEVTKNINRGDIGDVGDIFSPIPESGKDDVVDPDNYPEEIF